MAKLGVRIAVTRRQRNLRRPGDGIKILPTTLRNSHLTQAPVTMFLLSHTKHHFDPGARFSGDTIDHGYLIDMYRVSWQLQTCRSRNSLPSLLLAQVGTGLSHTQGKNQKSRKVGEKEPWSHR